jgi:hypothetical protein
MSGAEISRYHVALGYRSIPNSLAAEFGDADPETADVSGSASFFAGGPPRVGGS